MPGALLVLQGTADPKQPVLKEAYRRALTAAENAGRICAKVVPMGKRLHMEAAAARHMGSWNAGVAGEDGTVRPSGAVRAEPARSYRRKRAVVIALSVLVSTSVPALIVLLVLFG
ncbi:hypothetical protein [Arthrobacter caoxuetaonis]|uniref:Uncharacterized protein n=2 Tax=Arthrobacter TaxID=1663 RepID=A0A9X1ME98_9MICC|nr:hypothetical protein [Arthrobacter caoxuetaonis]MCC3297615.1 hypothetical protein [Arthrobacter caoxuetaonis]USQ56177.1 hypothetical protein NF551_10430 [Arthrobacter caoxuetaonis]